MAKHLAILVLLAAAGCASSSGSSGGTGGSAADATAASDTAAKTDATASTGSDAAASADGVAGPKRAAGCEAPNNDTMGKKKPWAGFTAGDKTFTCNNCRGGDPVLQGTWRQIDFKTEDPATPMGDDKDVITFDGNSWKEHIAGMDGGKLTEQTIDGWYFCSDAVEGLNKDEVFVIDKAAPEGTFGNSSGSFTRVTALASGKDLIALVLHEKFNAPAAQDKTSTYNYCRVGSTIKGHLCDDPFATK